MQEDERRQFKRVWLLQPIRGSAGRRVVYVLDGSAGGFCVLHRGALPAPGHSCKIVLQMDGSVISADCEVVRTEPRTGSGRSDFFRSGVRIVRADEQVGARASQPPFVW